MANDSIGNGGPDRAALAELGERLRLRRLELGLELTDVEESTKVRARYLSALEDGEVGVMPGNVYAIGFVRAFAEYLGLDAGTIVQQYTLALEHRPAQAEAKAPEQHRERPRPVPPPEEQVREPRARRAERRPRLGREAEERASSAGKSGGKASGRRTWLAVLLVLVVAIATYVGYSALHLAEVPPGGTTPGGTTPGGTTPGGNTPGGTTPGGTTPGGTTPGGKTPEGFTAANIVTRTGPDGRLEVVVDWQELSLDLAFLDRVWLRAEGDGVLQFEGTQEPGSVLSLAAGERIYLRLGRAKQTMIAVFGLDVGPAGASDDARTVIIMRKE